MNSSHRNCPECGGSGRAVSSVTIGAMLPMTTNADGFRFCKSTDCDVVYFSERDPAAIYKSRDLKVVVFQKSSAPDRPVCYCFSHSVRDVQLDAARTGGHKVVSEIQTKCRDGLDRCEELNPQGSCCLGNVHKLIRATIDSESNSTNDGALMVDGCCGSADDGHETSNTDQ